MTHRRTLRMFLPFALFTALLTTAASAQGATMIGMESNRELVNSTQTPELQAQALDLMKEQGVQVVRANYRWYDAAEGCAGQTSKALENPNNPCYNWGRFDGIVKQANDRGMQVLISIQQNPVWLLNTDNRLWMGTTNKQFARVLEHYVAFHKAAATRYKQGSPNGFIKFWTVHNEPNSRNYWGGGITAPNVARYAQLYGRTAVAIKQASPTSLIAPGPTGPTGGSGGIKPRKFLQDFQKHVVKYLPGGLANKKRYINAYAHNPYPGYNIQPSKTKTVPHPDNITMGSIDRLFQQLDRAPITRGTNVWATEYGWETNGPFSTSLNLQQIFIPEAFDWLDSKRRVTIGISYNMTDPPAADTGDWTSGTITNGGIKKPSFKMFQRMISVPAAGLSNGVKRGTVVKVWGRSNVNPAGGRLAYNIVGTKAWYFIPGQRKDANKGIRASFKVTRNVRFAVWDPTGGKLGTYGPTRAVAAR